MLNFLLKKLTAWLYDSLKVKWSKSLTMSQEETKNEQNLLCIKVLPRKNYYFRVGIHFSVSATAQRGWDEDDNDENKEKGSIVELNNERIAFMFFLVIIIKALDDVYHHTWQWNVFAISLPSIFMLCVYFILLYLRTFSWSKICCKYS